MTDSNVTALRIADGDGTRWGNYLGVPKHLAPVDGVPILYRTVRLLPGPRTGAPSWSIVGKFPSSFPIVRPVTTLGKLAGRVR